MKITMQLMRIDSGSPLRNIKIGRAVRHSFKIYLIPDKDTLKIIEAFPDKASIKRNYFYSETANSRWYDKEVFIPSYLMGDIVIRCDDYCFEDEWVPIFDTLYIFLDALAFYMFKEKHIRIESWDVPTHPMYQNHFSTEQEFNYYDYYTVT